MPPCGVWIRPSRARVKASVCSSSKPKLIVARFHCGSSRGALYHKSPCLPRAKDTLAFWSEIGYNAPGLALLDQRRLERPLEGELAGMSQTLPDGT